MKNQFKKLPKLFKTKWVAALRSGKFKQGQNHLKSKGHDGIVRYCCLGVACDVAGYKTIFGQTSFIGYEKKSVPVMLRGEKTLTQGLAGMNDEGISFKKIANWIEKNL